MGEIGFGVGARGLQSTGETVQKVGGLIQYYAIIYNPAIVRM